MARDDEHLDLDFDDVEAILRAEMDDASNQPPILRRTRDVLDFDVDELTARIVGIARREA